MKERVGKKRGGKEVEGGLSLGFPISLEVRILGEKALKTCTDRCRKIGKGVNQ